MNVESVGAAFVNPAQYVIPLDIVCESCAVCESTGKWIDRRGTTHECFACSGRGVVAFESFELLP